MTEILGLAAGWFGPILDEASPDRWAGRALMIGVGLLMLVGVLWIRRIIDPGPLSRGEARWRYRDRTRRERFAATLASSEVPDYGQTRGWWITRIEFGIAINAVVIGFLLLSVLRPGLMWHEPGLALEGILSVVAFVGMLVGLGWMVRIYRAGLRNDAPATWRYRDRQS